MRSTLLVWLLLVGSLWASDSNPAVLVLGGVTAVIASALFAAFDLGQTSAAVKWPQREPRLDDDQRATRMRRDAYAAAASDSRRIHDTLVELVDDRLLSGHRIDRIANPEAAQAVLTPALARLVAGPRRVASAPRDLQRILSDIEAL